MSTDRALETTDNTRVAGLGSVFGNFLKPTMEGASWLERKTLQKGLGEMGQAAEWAKPAYQNVTEVADVAKGLASRISPQVGRALIQFKNARTPGAALNMASQLDNLLIDAAEGLPSTFRIKNSMIAEAGSLKTLLSDTVEVKDLTSPGGRILHAPLRDIMSAPHNFEAVNPGELSSKLQAFGAASEKVAGKFANVEALAGAGRVGLTVATMAGGALGVKYLLNAASGIAGNEFGPGHDNVLDGPVPNSSNFLGDPTYKPQNGNIPGVGTQQPSSTPFQYPTTPQPPLPPPAPLNNSVSVSPFNAGNVILGNEEYYRVALAQADAESDPFQTLLMGVANALKGVGPDQLEARLEQIVSNVEKTLQPVLTQASQVDAQAQAHGVNLNQQSNPGAGATA
jgi:hypothetical protein